MPTKKCLDILADFCIVVSALAVWVRAERIETR